MKILIVSQRYWPESFRITDIAESFVNCGHSVTVVTGMPMYPKGYIFDEYKKTKKLVEYHNGVEIIRVKEMQRKNNFVSRICSYYSFVYFGNRKIKKITGDFDIVLANELSPIIGSIPALKYKSINNCKVLMYEMDLWPESLLASGIRTTSFIYKHFKKVSGKIYSQCDKIFVSTKEHIDYIKKLPYCTNVNVEYLPQYAEEQFQNIHLTFDESGIINLLFAGNIGKAQSIETIIKAASLLKQDKKFKFHIVGGGSELNNCILLTKKFGLDNIIFYGPRPLDEMPKFYEMAQVMLVTLEDSEYANLTIPGKMQSYIASGKPVIGALNGSGYNFILNKKIGLACEAGDYFALAKNIKSLDKEHISIYGKNAKFVYENQYKKDYFISKLLFDLKKYSKQ